MQPVSLVFKLSDSLAVWFAVRFVQGVAAATLYVLSEAWIVRFAGDRHRGRVVAVYASLLSASFAVGPVVVSLVGVDGWAPFVWGVAVLLAGTVPLFSVNDSRALEAPEATSHVGVIQFAPLAPVLLGTVGVFAIMDASLMALLPVYGLERGLDVQSSTWLLSVFVAGNVLLQYPIGVLADHFDARRIMGLCALVCGVSFVTLTLVIGTLWQWPTAVIGGAAGFGIYTVALKTLGDRFRGDLLVAGTSAFGVVWGAGALFGAVLGGWSMTAFGPNGLPSLLATCCIGLALALGWRARQVAE